MTLVREHHLPDAKGRELWRLAVTILLLGFAATFCRPLLLLIFPGMLLIHLRWWKQGYLSDLIPAVVGTSLAFWIVSFWFVPYLRLPLSIWAAVVLVLATILWGLGVWRCRDDALLVVDRQDVFALTLLMIATALRFSSFWRWALSPAGGDMAMHGYLAALIVDVNSVPSTHQPLLPIDRFGAYPVGFQALTALMSLLGDMPVYRSALLMEASTLALLTFAFYRFLRVFWDRQVSAIVAILVTFLPRNPQAFIHWGGDPTLLALALLVLALGFLPWLKQRLGLGAWALCALILAASVLTHLIPMIGLLYTVIPLAAYLALREKTVSSSELRLVVGNLLGIGVLSSVLLAVAVPHLLSTEVSAAEVEWVRKFQQEWAGGVWGGTLGNAVVTIPQYLVEKIFGGTFLGLSGIGLIVLTWRWPHLGVASIITVLTVVGLIINSMYWVLPLSYALYPERVALLLLLPFSLGIGAVLHSLRSLFPTRALRLCSMCLTAALVLFISVREHEWHFSEGLVANCLLTGADVQAMRWIEANTDPGSVFHNHYGDAGLWIPAIAFRSITDPHLNPFYFDEFQAAATGLKAQYVYIGQKKALGAPIALEAFESAPEKYRKVYAEDGVIIYEIINQGASGAVEFTTGVR
jgi:hypothetical protein